MRNFLIVLILVALMVPCNAATLTDGFAGSYTYNSSDSIFDKTFSYPVDDPTSMTLTVTSPLTYADFTETDNSTYKHSTALSKAFPLNGNLINIKSMSAATGYNVSYTTDRNSNANSAATLNSSAYISTTTIGNQTSIYIGGWIKPTGVTGNQRIIDTGGKGYFGLYNNYLQFVKYDGTSKYSRANNLPISAGQWTHVAFYYNTSVDNYYHLYVNGVETTYSMYTLQDRPFENPKLTLSREVVSERCLADYDTFVVYTNVPPTIASKFFVLGYQGSAIYQDGTKFPIEGTITHLNNVDTSSLNIKSDVPVSRSITMATEWTNDVTYTTPASTYNNTTNLYTYVPHFTVDPITPVTTGSIEFGTPSAIVEYPYYSASISSGSLTYNDTDTLITTGAFPSSFEADLTYEYGNNKTMDSWTYTQEDIPAEGNEKAVFIAWLVDGTAPTNNEDFEVVFSDFNFTSADGTIYGNNPNPANYFNWSGYQWTVRSTTGGPGPNYFNNSSQSVWVDEDDKLHLKIRNVGGTWYCAEIYSVDYLGLGTYRCTIDTDLNDIDPNIVVSMFAYYNDTNEIDIEFSEWGVPGNENGNTQYAIQPAEEEGNLYRFSIEDAGQTTHMFTWLEDSVAFRSDYGIYVAPEEEVPPIEDEDDPEVTDEDVVSQLNNVSSYFRMFAILLGASILVMGGYVISKGVSSESIDTQTIIAGIGLSILLMLAVYLFWNIYAAVMTAVGG